MITKIKGLISYLAEMANKPASIDQDKLAWLIAYEFRSYKVADHR